MRFTHHPRTRWVYDPNRLYPRNDASYKPSGLWLAVDDDWRRWCNDEGMDDWTNSVTVEFTVDMEQMLHLRTAGDIDNFTDTFRHRDDDKYRNRIGWDAVVDRYAGIVIAPYCWERRPTDHTFWYYGWDCASACVWDLSAVEMVGVLSDDEATA